MNMNLTTPITDEMIASLNVGDIVTISGYILCGRDAVLPKVLAAFEAGETLFLLVTEDGDMYFADGSGVTEELLREKFDSLDRRMYGITDPVERSAIARRTHGEFTAKLRAAYSPQKSNHIEGWYYNYMNRNNN